MTIKENENSIRINQETNYTSTERNKINHPFHPWRRYFARMFDIFIYNILWSTFLAFIFHVNFLARGSMLNLFDSFMSIAIMLFLEPLWLHFFGTTLGKLIFGIRIEDSNGKHLSYGEGLERTWGVIGAGMGYNIPIYSLVRLWKSYKLSSDNITQPWNESISYSIKDTKFYRILLYIGASIALFAIFFTIVSAPKLPPNRDDLTVEEFVENYNYYANYYDIDFGNKYLNKNGKWTDKEVYGATYTGISRTNRPEYHFITENGYVRGVSFEVEIINNENWISPYDTQMILSSLAFVSAQKEIGIFSDAPKRIIEQIENNSFKDFNFEEAGVSITSNVEYSGYKDMSVNFLMPEENTIENYFNLDFLIEKQSSK